MPARKKVESSDSVEAVPVQTIETTRYEPVTVDEIRYVALRKMKMNGKVIKPGDIVPGAEHWVRRESWERSGYIKKVA